MSKNLVINTAKRKKNSVAALERELEGKVSEPSYRFTAVLPEAVGQRLRVHCARNRLKIKNVFAEAVMEFLAKCESDPINRD